MRELTFQGFLKNYIRTLSDTSTLSISRLAKEVLPNKSRIAEPLYLYAVIIGDNDRLAKLTSVAYYKSEFEDLNSSFTTREKLLDALEKNSSTIPPRYQKVFNTYVAQKNRINTDREYCLSARNTIRNLQQELHVTNYRLYKDLELNPGNVNNYLRNGTVAHISRATVQKILNYLRAIEAKGLMRM